MILQEDYQNNLPHNYSRLDAPFLLCLDIVYISSELNQYRRDQGCHPKAST